MSGFEDLFTHSLADAARFEQMRGDDWDDRPQRSEFTEWDVILHCGCGGVCKGECDEPEDAEEWR